MKSMTTVLLSLAFIAGPVMAQPKADDHSAHHATANATASTAMSEGEVRKVDKGAAKLTLRHGEIKNLEMPGMTMVFLVKEPALLDKVKVGDKVKFRAEKSAGNLVVTALELAP